MDEYKDVIVFSVYKMSYYVGLYVDEGCIFFLIFCLEYRKYYGWKKVMNIRVVNWENWYELLLFKYVIVIEFMVSIVNYILFV